MNISYIGLGSNMGEKEKYISDAISMINDNNCVVIKESNLYITKPVGYAKQDWFLNKVIAIETSLSALDLLAVLLKIELDLGRERIIHWGPRTIDLDILLFNNDKIDLDNLIVPHPRIHERLFVLKPLAEINGDYVLPEGSINYLLITYNGDEEVILYKKQIR